MDDQPKTNVLWWAVPFAVMLLVAILAMFGAVEPPQQPPQSSSYDASGDGVRAVYLLLERLGYDVVQSRRGSAGHVRWLLYPNANTDDSGAEDETPLRSGRRQLSAQEEARNLEYWLQAGGILLLADETGEFARALGLRVQLRDAPAAMSLEIEAARRLRLDCGPILLEAQARPDRVWPDRGEPLVSIIRRGRGEVWLIRRPSIFRNKRIRDADNAIAVCALANALSSDRKERIYFDEYFHGMREHRGPVQLLFRPPALWATLQALAVLALILWHSLPRFGALRDAPPIRRRSKEEFLDAMAHLLGRKGAYTEALAVVRADLFRDLEQALQLPAHTPVDVLAAQAARRRPGLDKERLELALSEPRVRVGRGNFLAAIHELDQLRGEFFHE